MFTAIKERFEWHIMKKIAAAHPFFAMKGRLLSMRDAEALLKGREIPDGKDVIKQARIELGIPEPINGVESTKRAALTQGILSTHILRRIIAVAASLAILCGFFTFTNIGRAFAESIYKVIVNIVSGSLQSHNRNSAGNIEPIDFSEIPNEFESLKEIAEITGRQIIVPGNDDDKLTQFSTHVVGAQSLVIKSIYTTRKGIGYTLVQTLYSDATLWGSFASTTDDNVCTIEIPLGIKAYVSTMLDGTAYAEAYGLGYDINVSSVDMCADDIQELVFNLKVFS